MLKGLSFLAANLDTYGLKPRDLRLRMEGLSLALEEYTTDEIMEAMKIYLKTGEKMPRPIDLISIINSKVRGRHDNNS